MRYTIYYEAAIIVNTYFISGKAYHNQKGTPKDTLENLNLKKMESIGQMITDLIVSRENFGLGER